MSNNSPIKYWIIDKYNCGNQICQVYVYRTQSIADSVPLTLKVCQATENRFLCNKKIIIQMESCNQPIKFWLFHPNSFTNNILAAPSYILYLLNKITNDEVRWWVYEKNNLIKKINLHEYFPHRIYNCLPHQKCNATLNDLKSQILINTYVIYPKKNDKRNINKEDIENIRIAKYLYNTASKKFNNLKIAHKKRKKSIDNIRTILRKFAPIIIDVNDNQTDEYKNALAELKWCRLNTKFAYNASNIRNYHCYTQNLKDYKIKIFKMRNMDKYEYINKIAKNVDKISQLQFNIFSLIIDKPKIIYSESVAINNIYKLKTLQGIDKLNLYCYMTYNDITYTILDIPYVVSEIKKKKELIPYTPIRKPTNINDTDNKVSILMIENNYLTNNIAEIDKIDDSVYLNKIIISETKKIIDNTTKLPFVLLSIINCYIK
jgi:hypothetical protein